MMTQNLALTDRCGNWDAHDFIVIVFPIRDGGSSYVPLNYYPWCRTKVNEESSETRMGESDNG
jgi:hypothetical protein